MQKVLVGMSLLTCAGSSVFEVLDRWRQQGRLVAMADTPSVDSDPLLLVRRHRIRIAILRSLHTGLLRTRGDGCCVGRVWSGDSPLVSSLKQAGVLVYTERQLDAAAVALAALEADAVTALELS